MCKHWPHYQLLSILSTNLWQSLCLNASANFPANPSRSKHHCDELKKVKIKSKKKCYFLQWFGDQQINGSLCKHLYSVLVYDLSLFQMRIKLSWLPVTQTFLFPAEKWGLVCSNYHLLCCAPCWDCWCYRNLLSRGGSIILCSPALYSLQYGNLLSN